jgi:hypothetical protein
MAQTILVAQRASHTLSGAHGSHLTGLPYLQEGLTRTSFLSVLQLASQVSFLLAIPLLHVLHRVERIAFARARYLAVAECIDKSN